MCGSSLLEGRENVVRSGMTARRVRLTVVVVGLGALALAGCGGANERRASTGNAPAPGAPSTPVAGAQPPSSPTAPTKPADPKCAPLANFQLLNYSARTFDAKQF